MQHFTIFQHLDEPKRYMGFTLIEIIAVVSIVIISFILQKLAIGLVVSLITFRIIRAVTRLNKINYYKRWMNAHYQDLKSGPNRSRRFFF